MEDFRVDLIIGQGPGAQIHPFPLSHFTLVGATTRAGLITAPLRSRFGIVHRLDFYEPADLLIIIHRSAKIQAVHDTDRKSTRLNSSHLVISYAVFCLKKKKKK